MGINKRQWMDEKGIITGSFIWFKILGLEDDVFKDLTEVVYDDKVIDLNVSDWYVYVTHQDVNGNEYTSKLWSW